MRLGVDMLVSLLIKAFVWTTGLLAALQFYHGPERKRQSSRTRLLWGDLRKKKKAVASGGGTTVPQTDCLARALGTHVGREVDWL